MSKTIRIGSGAAWWGDRVEPAALNAERGKLDYLCFETMAEATVSAAQVRARRDPGFPGYDTYLDDRMRAVLPACMRQGTRIVSQPGLDQSRTARPQRIVHWLRELGFKGVKVAAVNGSLITDRVLRADRPHPRERRGHQHAGADADLGRGLPRRRADRRGAAARARRSWSPAGSPTRRSSWRR